MLGERAEHPAEKILAQGAVFACAALMVCEGIRYTEGAEFQASESAPRWRVQMEPLVEGDLELDRMANPRGYLELRRIS